MDQYKCYKECFYDIVNTKFIDFCNEIKTIKICKWKILHVK